MDHKHQNFNPFHLFSIFNLSSNSVSFFLNCPQVCCNHFESSLPSLHSKICSPDSFQTESIIISFSIHLSPWFLKASQGFQKERNKDGRKEGTKEGSLTRLHTPGLCLCFRLPLSQSLNTLSDINRPYFCSLCCYTRFPLDPMFLPVFFPLRGMYSLLFKSTNILFLFEI